MNKNNNIYDDVFRTLTVDCEPLLIPMVNEIFHEQYHAHWTAILHQNEIFLRQQEGESEKRITDSSFKLVSEDGTSRRYHLECQSTTDGSMLIRMYEYDSQLALQDGEFEADTLNVKFPASAILYLRHTKNTPNFLKIHISTSGGSISYNIPAMKIKQYSIEEIFEKNLFFLIPFYIFRFEAKLGEINNDHEKLEVLQQEYVDIMQKLNVAVEEEIISEYIKVTICEMTAKVIRHLATRYEKVVKGVSDIMGGKVLDHEAKRILNKGKLEGKLEGFALLVKKGLLAIEDAARELEMSVEDFQKKMTQF